MTSHRQDIHNSNIPALCRACEARHKGVCGALSPAQLRELNQHTQRSTVNSASLLLADQEKITQYANILSGVVKLSKMLEDGRQQIVGLQFAPDFLGRPFAQESTVAAEAATELQICSFPKSVLDRLVRETPELESRLFQQTQRELDEARDWMLALGRKTASEKVASFLHFIASHVDPEAKDGNVALAFDLPLTRADMADFLGLTVETVSRQMTRLKKEKIIEIEQNRHIVIPEINRLTDACDS